MFQTEGLQTVGSLIDLPFSRCQKDEEEERRKRRREKNKVAAARCRNKKKERTEYLQRVSVNVKASEWVQTQRRRINVSSTLPLKESERLEMMNSELKSQIEELKHERQQLILMLNRHRPTCIVRTDSIKSPEKEANPLLEQVEAEWEGPTRFHVTVYRLAPLQLAEALGSKHLDIFRKDGGLRPNKATRKTHWWWPQYIGRCVGSYENFYGIVFLL